jgi:selenocysteine-specific elongation factor
VAFSKRVFLVGLTVADDQAVSDVEYRFRAGRLGRRYTNAGALTLGADATWLAEAVRPGIALCRTAMMNSACGLEWQGQPFRGKTYMPRDLILGTAGHIDHGKTALVKALTGIDCDRLPEEMARGITIDIGFAHLELDGYRLGIVDVPGHERFIRNMLAGATGVDLGLLVVAADDSIMPQTREHLEILQLLGLRHGLVALTKADLVDETTRAVVMLEIRDLTRGTFLAEAPIIATSAKTGLGMPELKAALLALCRQTEAAPRESWFRMAIDRCFTVAGHGTVVTGSVTSGRLRVGAEVEWLPRGERLRVRGLQNHDQPVEEVRRGMRAAVNLAGVKHDEIARGDELATPGFLVPSRVMTLRVHALPSHPRPLPRRAAVHFHLGAAELMGVLALLDAEQLNPGQWGLAQIYLTTPAVAQWGQPFVVRNASATRTLGGGVVVQPAAGKIRRRHVELMPRLQALATGTAAERARQAAWFRGFQGVTLGDLARGAGLTPAEAEAQIAALTQAGALRALTAAGQKQVVIEAEWLDQLNERIVTILQRAHEQFPLLTSHDRQKVEAQFGYIPDAGLAHHAVEQLLKAGRLVGDGRRIALAEHRPKLSAAQRKLKERIVAAHRAAGFQPPEPKEFAPQAGGHAAGLRDLYEVCVAEGDLVQLGPDLFLHAEHEAELRRRVRAKLNEGKGLTVAEIRDLLGTTRKFAVPFCEYLDKIGVTRREGDLRK